jgi:hypothetical protein
MAFATSASVISSSFRRARTSSAREGSRGSRTIRFPLCVTTKWFTGECWQECKEVRRQGDGCGAVRWIPGQPRPTQAVKACCGIDRLR